MYEQESLPYLTKCISSSSLSWVTSVGFGSSRTLKVYGGCWDNTLSKADLYKRTIYRKKRGGRNGYIQDFFPLLFSWQSLQLRTAELSPVPVTFPEAAEYSFVSWGPGSVCDDVGVWGKWSGNGNREVDTRGLVRQTAVCWAFRTEKQLARGTRREEKSKGKKKKYTSLFIAISPIGRTFCWGGCLPRTSNSVCSTHFIFKPECRFYSWDVTGPVWAGMGKLTSEIFTSWKGPSESLPVHFRADLHFLSCQWNASLGSVVKVWEALRGHPSLRHHRAHTPAANAYSRVLTKDQESNPPGLIFTAT